MKIRVVLLLIVSLGAPLFGELPRCGAQWNSRNQPLQKPLRLLGHGWSSGYHWRTPGHDSSYYNPYSAHNSNVGSHSWNQDYYGFETDNTKSRYLRRESTNYGFPPNPISQGQKPLVESKEVSSSRLPVTNGQIEDRKAFPDSIPPATHPRLDGSKGQEIDELP